MAATVANGNGASTPTTLDDVGKPPEGIVVPPKDIRAIVEKTAGYVARNGPVFEERVRAKENTNPKFSFLDPKDPYAPFYRWRLQEIKEGRGTDVAAGRPGEGAAAAQKKPSGPTPPPEFHFSARMPIINAQDLDVVNLTALFVAKRGKSFMTALSQREAGNYQFDFLRPQHSLYQFFTRLVDQYRILLSSEGIDEATSEKRRIEALERNIKDKYSVLERAKQRAEWVKYQEQQKQKKEEEAEKERIEYQQIDWHDFVVVETVLFTEADDQMDLPPPASLGDLQSASLEQKAKMSLNTLRIEEAMPTDQEEPTYYNAYPPEQPPGPAITPAPGPQQPPPPTTTAAAPIAPATTAQETRQPATTAQQPPAAQPHPTAPPGQPPMRIRSDYVPRAQARRQNQGGATALCPNCHQQIPVNELDHHMRIELLDPRWKEQRAKADERASTTNLSTFDVVNNLKRLASQRQDVFDSTNVGNNQVEAEEESRRKRMALPPGVPGYLPTPVVPNPNQQQPPGTTAPAPGPAIIPQKPQTTNIQEQIRSLHERYGQQPPRPPPQQ
ncbi:hypothetical protein VTN49DRAFT_1695 [Thermomyces lanuginosus]|uniref:uncharacterized protein n=1 Tax=Thermomyces lanuginosus TaxID=5541 RepID=UPI0037440E17